jgi:hypothetical protein
VRKKKFVFSKEEFCSEFYAMKRNVMGKRMIFITFHFFLHFLQMFVIIALKCGQPFCLLMLGIPLKK